MRHEERRVINHSPLNLFKLVSDVKKYPEFLPWCLGSRVKNNSKNNFDADLIIGFKIYKEIYKHIQNLQILGLAGSEDSENCEESSEFPSLVKKYRPLVRAPCRGPLHFACLFLLIS